MRRRLAALLAATAAALGGAGALAGPASAAPGSPGAPAGPALAAASGTSVLWYCPGSSTNAHPGLHTGWSRSSDGERRNLGGRCL